MSSHPVVSQLYFFIEREQYQHRSLLDVADKEKELELASRQFANPTADPADAAEASRKCERLRNELKQAKLFNNSKVAQNMYDEKRIEGLVEQIRQKEECKRRLLSVLGRVQSFHLKMSKEL